MARREIAVKLRDRNLLISTAVTMIAIIVSLTVTGFLSGRTETIDIAVTGPGAGEVVAMPARLAAGTAAWWEPIIALALMAAAAYGTVVIAERLNRRSLMQTQGRLTIRQASARED
ncbi:ABC transporter permease family protein [Nocardia terrae]|uniref:hypothetical protein n=1 Tax=Nocardia terrae TaxID=2675851 RepID=UPI0018E01B78|nr:hypothetical protein [Nocardia terrae]